MAETLTKPNTNSPDASGDRDRSRGRSAPAQEDLQGLEKVFIPYEGFLGTSAVKEQLRRSVAQPVQTALEEPAGEASFLDALLGTSMLEPPIERHAAIMSDPRFSHPANVPTSSRIVNRLHQTYGNGHVQRVADLVQAIQDEGLSGEEVSANIERTIASKRGAGKPLESGTRTQMESLLGRDFSDVNIHTDRTADTLAKALQAKAFTVGSDVFFQEGAYEPGSEAGKKLLGHELTHVVQQTEGIGANSQLSIGPSEGVREREPSELAQRVVEGQMVAVHEVSAIPLIQRQPGLSAPTLAIAQEAISTDHPQEAINAIAEELSSPITDIEWRIELPLIEGGEMLYNPALTQRTGQAIPRGTSVNPATGATRVNPVLVEIGDLALGSVSMLYSTIIHEYHHVLQIQSQLRLAGTQTEEDHAREVDAYLVEIEASRRSGIFEQPSEMLMVWRALHFDHWVLLSRPTQDRLRARYEAARAIVEEALGPEGIDLMTRNW